MGKVEYIVLGSLLLLICVVPFREGNDYIVQGITQIVLLLCGMLWGTRVIRRGQIQCLCTRLDWALAGLFLWWLVAIVTSAYTYATALEFVKFVSYLAVFYFCRLLFPLERRRIILLCTIVGSCVFQAILAWGWYVTDRTPMLQADFINPNFFAAFLVFGVNIAWAFLLFSRDPKIGKKLLAACCLLLLVVTVFAVQSRGAALSLVVTGFLLTTLRKKRLGVLFLVICAGILLFPTPQGSMFQKLQKRGDTYAYERINIWKSGLAMARDYPAFGISPGMFAYYSKPYNFPVERSIARYGKNITVAHNELLQLTVELGLPGLLVGLAGLGFLARSGVRQFRKTPPDWPITAVSAALLGFCIHCMVSHLLISAALAIIAAILAAILLDGEDAYFSTPLRFRKSWLWYPVAALLCLSICLYGILYPFLGHWYYLRHAEFLRQKEMTQAVGSLEAAIAWVPIHPSYYYALGYLSLNTFRTEPAVQTFKKAEDAFIQAISYNPRDYQYYETLGILYRELFNTNAGTREHALRSLEVYQAAHELNPFNPFLLFSMATLQVDIEEYEEAVTLLQEAIDIEPNFVGAHHMLGRLYVRLDRPDDAEAAVQHAETILERYKSTVPPSHYVKSLLRPLK